MMSDLEVGASRKIFCNTCKNENNHKLKTVHLREYIDVFHEGTLYVTTGFEETFQYRLWACQGCDTCVLQVWDSTFYPNRKERDLELKPFLQLPQNLKTIYREIIGCYNSDSKILCTIGLRALLEGVCVDKNITKYSLKHKVDGLDILLPDNIVTGLHKLRDMGNMAAHELQTPTKKDLKLAIDIMEDILNFLYDLEYKAQRLPKKE